MHYKVVLEYIINSWYWANSYPVVDIHGKITGEIFYADIASGDWDYLGSFATIEPLDLAIRISEVITHKREKYLDVEYYIFDIKGLIKP